MYKLRENSNVYVSVTEDSVEVIKVRSVNPICVTKETLPVREVVHIRGSVHGVAAIQTAIEVNTKFSYGSKIVQRGSQTPDEGGRQPIIWQNYYTTSNGNKLGLVQS